MLEQELASIIKYTLDRARNPSPYYYDVPRSFNVPAVYFPTPEISTGGETFSTYYMDYVWYIKFFHRSSQRAYALGMEVLTAIKGSRNLIPLISKTGEETGGGIRLNDPKLKVLDNGAAQLTLEWRSRRPYNAEEATKMQSYEVEGWKNPDIYLTREIPAAYTAALERYAITLPTPPIPTGKAPGTP
ncbi:hypothetical protein [Mediterraneibacter gnavus]|uniref:hypothetical protein n=1 Tax=Mediterraneibacter gnavus TaxID=33038 RepID=UPI000C7D62A2|nr:hypothetical protein [Mediterraneibacter gnavus]PLT76266.1 hypothetical protein CDL24_11340 [Mediterraneibacter gnavus]